MKPSVLIIGAGFTGLTAAYRLLRQGTHEVTVLERGQSVGGLASDFKIAGFPIEKAYHHLFRTDTEILSLIDELGLGGDMMWPESSMAIVHGGKSYPFSTPKDLLCFSPLPLLSRIRLGAVVYLLQKYKKGTRLDSHSASQWIRAKAGKDAARVIWDPLLKGKFSTYAQRVSMAWLWARIHIRANSRDPSGGREKLGYLAGGFGRVAHQLRAAIEQLGGTVETSARIECIKQVDTGWQACSNGVTRDFDRIAFTGSNPAFARLLEASGLGDPGYLASLRSIHYLNAICLVFATPQELGPAYWTNVNEGDAPFLVFINHTRLVPAARYGGLNIYYIGAYLEASSKLWQAADTAIMANWYDYLRKLFPEFVRASIVDEHLFRFNDAQHVVDGGYASRIPKMNTPLPGLLLSNFSQIYPEDRGTNYAVREGNRLAESLGA